MDPRRHIAALEQAGVRFSRVLATVDLDAPVPPCPGWDVRDLTQHLGGIHRWATAYVARGRKEPIDLELEELVGGWPPDEALAGWFVDGHAGLVAALQAAPPDLECFTFLDAPTPLAMWARRQAHETSIHRVDLESAAGHVTGFSPEFAADGIDELLTAFITRPGRGPRASRPTSLVVAPNDSQARWLVSFDATSCQTERSDGEADTRVMGTASDLYAWAWNRPSVQNIDIHGDPAVIEAWRDTVHVRWS